MCDKYWQFDNENIESNYQCTNQQFKEALRLFESGKKNDKIKQN
jgi:hypothetical protein